MPTYRCHFLDREERLKHAAEIDARSLSDAMAQAREILKIRRAHSFEIWLRGWRLHPARRENGAADFHSAEETVARLEEMLGSLAGVVREPRPHKSKGGLRGTRPKLRAEP
jgi:hypothetical protein